MAKAKTSKQSAGVEEVIEEVTVNRRVEQDRRVKDVPVAVERRKVQRRRQIDPTTCERDYSGDEIEFMHALDEYKRKSGRMFPTCSEILEVIRDLGYRKASLEQLAEEKRRAEELLQDSEGSTVSSETDGLDSDEAMLEGSETW